MSFFGGFPYVQSRWERTATWSACSTGRWSRRTRCWWTCTSASSPSGRTIRTCPRRRPSTTVAKWNWRTSPSSSWPEYTVRLAAVLVRSFVVFISGASCVVCFARFSLRSWIPVYDSIVLPHHTSDRPLILLLECVFRFSWIAMISTGYNFNSWLDIQRFERPKLQSCQQKCIIKMSRVKILNINQWDSQTSILIIKNRIRLLLQLTARYSTIFFLPKSRSRKGCWLSTVFGKNFQYFSRNLNSLHRLTTSIGTVEIGDSDWNFSSIFRTRFCEEDRDLWLVSINIWQRRSGSESF